MNIGPVEKLRTNEQYTKVANLELVKFRTRRLKLRRLQSALFNPNLDHFTDRSIRAVGEG
jgi:hypothetical protein